MAEWRASGREYALRQGGDRRSQRHDARRLYFEKLQHLRATEVHPKYDHALCIGPVQLEHVLGQIQSDEVNVHLIGRELRKVYFLRPITYALLPFRETEANMIPS
ncbi:hypothetical protein ABUE34_14660 (plasmid) [Kozakia baliensis]|uniref:hypothetical protein n=1 Tax=Kozakia baliensis TaxID=153496 RepID=UPI00345C0123